MQRNITRDSKENSAVKRNSPFTNHADLFAGEDGMVTEESINAVFAELNKYHQLKNPEKKSEKNGLKTLLSYLQPSEGKKVMTGAALFGVPGTCKFKAKGHPKDFIKMMHGDDTGFFDFATGELQNSLKDFLNNEKYFIDDGTGTFFITSQRFTQFKQSQKKEAEERWKWNEKLLERQEKESKCSSAYIYKTVIAPCLRRTIGPGASKNEFDQMFEFFGTKNAAGELVFSREDFKLFYQDTRRLYAKLYPDSKLPFMSRLKAENEAIAKIKKDMELSEGSLRQRFTTFPSSSNDSPLTPKLASIFEGEDHTPSYQQLKMP